MKGLLILLFLISLFATTYSTFCFEICKDCPKDLVANCIVKCRYLFTASCV